jgi:hypothetical protein
MMRFLARPALLATVSTRGAQWVAPTRIALGVLLLREDVMRVAAELYAKPYDVPDVELGHHGQFCSFDAFHDRFQLTDPALHKLARIVRGADTGRLDLTSEAAGLYAISVGLSRTFADDHEQLHGGMLMCDALYAWCQHDAHT